MGRPRSRGSTNWPMQRTRDLSGKEKEVPSLWLGLLNRVRGVSQESWSHPCPGELPTGATRTQSQRKLSVWIAKPPSQHA